MAESIGARSIEEGLVRRCPSAGGGSWNFILNSGEYDTEHGQPIRW